jgi:hypothetical protein
MLEGALDAAHGVIRRASASAVGALRLQQTQN